MNALKYFQEEANEFHVAAAGSLLGVKLSVPKSFPVGKVNFLSLHPMTFLEFLDALGEGRYRALLENLRDWEPLPRPFHEELVQLLRKYYCVGGMPEAVGCYAGTKDIAEVRKIQKEIITSYALDFAKHTPASDIPKLSHVWESIPVQLARENKKFLFSAIRKSARAREYENALLWLEDAGLIIRAFMTATARLPLNGYADRSAFKVYALDVGLLCAMAGLTADLLARGDRLFTEFKGALVENYVAQELRAASNTDLFYWKSASGAAEVDFLSQMGNSIYPLEVKAGINPKSKSLKSFDTHFGPPLLIRATLLNLRRDAKIVNIPLYAVSRIPQLLFPANP